jgi:hypothetical protein
MKRIYIANKFSSKTAKIEQEIINKYGYHDIHARKLFPLWFEIFESFDGYYYIYEPIDYT